MARSFRSPRTASSSKTPPVRFPPADPGFATGPPVVYRDGDRESIYRVDISTRYIPAVARTVNFQQETDVPGENQSPRAFRGTMPPGRLRVRETYVGGES